MPRNKDLDRAAVVAAAAALADECGDVNQVTLAQVAAHFNIKIPSLYNHVAGLDGLRRDVALLGVQDLTAQLQSAAVGRSGDEAVVAVARAYRDYARRFPGRYAATLQAPEPDDEERVATAQTLLEVIFRVLEAYHLSETDALHVVRALRSVLHGFVALEAAGGFKIPLDLDESYERLVQMFLAGLRAQYR